MARCMPARIFAPRSPAITSRRSWVSAGPGQTTFTVMPWRATSRASAFEKPMSAALQPEYTASPVLPTRPASEEMLTIRPRPRSIMPSSTACVALSAPLKLTAIRRSQSAGSLSTKSASRSQPALLTSTSTGPRASPTARTAPASADRSLTSAAAPSARPPAMTISFATARALPPSRSAMPTAIPARARRSAMARPIRSIAGGERGAEGAAHRHLALLVERQHLAVDALLAVVLVLLGDLALAGDAVARPDAGREAHLEAAEVLGADVVGHALADEGRGQHAVAEDARVARGARELLVGVDGIEVAGGARVADHIHARQALHHEGRDLAALAHVLEEDDSPLHTRLL